jgi:hypothetical protein
MAVVLLASTGPPPRRCTRALPWWSADAGLAPQVPTIAARALPRTNSVLPLQALLECNSLIGTSVEGATTTLLAAKWQPTTIATEERKALLSSETLCTTLYEHNTAQPRKTGEDWLELERRSRLNLAEDGLEVQKDLPCPWMD